MALGLDDESYSELLSVVAITTAADTFERATGKSRRALPAPQAGTPGRRRPAGARPGLGWMPMLAPADVTPDTPPLYIAGGRIGGNVHRALSLLPEATAEWRAELRIDDFWKMKV